MLVDTPTSGSGLGGTITGIAVTVFLAAAAVVEDRVTTACVVGVGFPTDVIVKVVAETGTSGATIVDAGVVFKVDGVVAATDCVIAEALPTADEELVDGGPFDCPREFFVALLAIISSTAKIDE